MPTLGGPARSAAAGRIGIEERPVNCARFACRARSGARGRLRSHADRMISIQTNPFFTMSKSQTPCAYAGETDARVVTVHENGGADRDRTGDLKLAKLALSQLSYGPHGREQ